MPDTRDQRQNRFMRLVMYIAGGLLITIAITWFGAWRSDLGSSNYVRLTPLEWDFDNIQFTVIWDRPLASRYIAVKDTRKDITGISNTVHSNLPNPITGSIFDRTTLIIDETGVFALTVEMQRLAASGRISELYDGQPKESLPLPRWFSPAVGYDAATGTHWMLHLEDAAGWPMRALRSRMRLAPIADTPTGSNEQFSWSIPLIDPAEIWSLRQKPAAPLPIGTPQPYSAFGQWKALPLLPIWTGLIGNTIFWAAAIALLFWVLKQPARLLRNKKDRCASCNYDLQGITSKRCPECGATIGDALSA